MSDSLTESPILFTGFPGFLSTHLIDVLAALTEAPLHFLCLDGTVEAAHHRLMALEASHPGIGDRCTVYTGDISKPRLGLDDEEYQTLTDQIGVVWHLAALYNLAVAEEIAYKVNVGGTVQVLDFCEACKDFKRLNYVSTCYVAGDRTGTIYEDELDVGQRHHNHYEETKFWAEVEVQRRKDEIPTTIFRPAIIVGDSRTGEIAKYDGPYYVFQLLHRLPDWMPVPAVGRGDAAVNLVPVDFAARALAHLGVHPEATGEVYQIADPHPMTARQIIDRTLKALDRRPTMGTLPAQWVERALANETVEQWTGVPREALTYFNHNARFDTAHSTQALDKLGIECPHLSSYLDRLLEFFLRHPDGPPEVGSAFENQL